MRSAVCTHRVPVATGAANRCELAAARWFLWHSAQGVDTRPAVRHWCLHGCRMLLSSPPPRRVNLQRAISGHVMMLLPRPLRMLVLVLIWGCSRWGYAQSPSLCALPADQYPALHAAEDVHRLSENLNSARRFMEPPPTPGRYAGGDVSGWPIDIVPTVASERLAALVPAGRVLRYSNMESLHPLRAFSAADFERGDAAMIGRPGVSNERLGYRELFSRQARGVVADVRHFYAPHNLLWLSGGVMAGAVMANTGFDEHLVRDSYLENVVLAPSDELYEGLHEPKFLGDGYYTIPVFAVAAFAEPIVDDLPLGSETAQWGQRSLRTILVGGPPLLGLQYLTGGGRPSESNESSEWRPFQDNNGVSGHSFMGAIPFMSAAKMTDNVWLKGGLYVASALPATSRINDDAHFFSQAFMGWWLAYLAESAVDHSFDSSSSRRWQFYPSADGTGVVVSTQW